MAPLPATDPWPSLSIPYARPAAVVARHLAVSVHTTACPYGVRTTGLVAESYLEFFRDSQHQQRTKQYAGGTSLSGPTSVLRESVVAFDSFIR